MDEKVVEQTPKVESQPQVTPAVIKPTGGNRNLMLAIVALIVGAVIISGIFIAAYPHQQADTTAPTTTTQTKQVTNITKTSDLNSANSELNSTNLDGYQTDLNQISASAASF